MILEIGNNVHTEWGFGTVVDSSRYRVVIALEDGHTINVVVGTPGYRRITKVA